MAVDGSEQQQPVLTSTTAPGKIFGSRAELAQHYKSQWHKYNLKRREAGLPPLLESDFEARLAAAQEALESSQKKNNSRRDAHLKKKNKNKQKQDKKNKRGQQQQTLEGQEEDNNGGVTRSSQALAYERIKQEREQQQQQEEGKEETEKNEEGGNTTNKEGGNTTTILGQQTDEPAEVPAATTTPPEVVEIDPRRCLFDGHQYLSKSVQDNVARMQRKYGFFIPDAEYLVDLPGLIGYCHEKISIGRICLYCQKGFSSARACQQHMVSKRHTKLRYEAGIDLHEFAVFYDFDEANREFLWSSNQKNVDKSGEEEKEDAEEKNNETKDNEEDEDDDEDDEWEDVSDDDDEEEAKNDDEDRDDMEDEDEEDVYAGYEEEVAAMGLDVTPLGELVFPDGRIIGHRAFRRYYRQRAPRRPDERTSVLAARQAAGDRLYQGRVVNVLTDDNSTGGNNNNNTTLAMARSSGAGLPPTPGGGKGLLVAASGGVADGQQQQQQQQHAFTQLSIYRYRAAMKKQRRDNAKAQRVQYRSTMNINRMDKKHNRLMNGVSVAHAAR